MAAFSRGRDYLRSYLYGSNKCIYARNACSAYDTSGMGRVEKRTFLIILENYRAFTEQGVVYNGLGEVQPVEMSSFHLYDFAYMINKAFEILSTTEDWDLQSQYEDAKLTAELEGGAFDHPLRDVQDAFGFAAGEAYRQWFLRNRPLLELFQELEEGGEFQIRDGLFAVDEDFVCRWNQAIQPERKYQEPHGYWSFQIGEGWVLDGFGQDN